MTNSETQEHALDRLRSEADILFDEHDFMAANNVYRQLADLKPDEFFYFARCVETSIKLGIWEIANTILERPNFPSNDEQFFWGCQLLIEAQSYKAAKEFIVRETKLGVVRYEYLAVGEARLLTSIGMRSRARAILKPILERNESPALAFQVGAMLVRDDGDLDQAVQIAMKGVQLHNRPNDARFVLEILILLADADIAVSFANQFAAVNGNNSTTASDLAVEAGKLKELCDRAKATLGEFSFASRLRIRDALTTDCGTETILWGKRSLISLLRSNEMTLDDFDIFSSYLPNWENGNIKSYVLFHALRTHPDNPRVTERWLRRMLSERCFGDAASWLYRALTTRPNNDLIAFAVILLRSNQAGLLPDETVADVVQRLESAVRDALPIASWALRATLYDHLHLLGIDGGIWYPAEDPLKDNIAFRRLLGTSTGRLNCSKLPGSVGNAGPCPVVVISGQVRGFATAWPALNRHVVAPLGAPVIMTVWDRTTNATGRHANRLERVLPDDVVAALRPEQRFTDAFSEAFPKTAGLVFGEWTETVHELAAILTADGVKPSALETESEALLMQLLRPQITNGMIRMYYKLARAERLIREAEIRNGIAFTHVIWSRPDFEITRISSSALRRCLAYDDVAFSSWTTEVSVGDYFMVLPRLAFATIAGVFGRVVIGGDSAILPWRPQREMPLAEETLLAAFGGPETIFEVLLAAGILPVGRIESVEGRLRGRTPSEIQIRESFFAELQGRHP